MKKIIFGVGMVFFLIDSDLALDVDKEELSKNARRVEFVNYTGPYRSPQGMEDLRAIGETLALIRETNKQIFYPDMRYSVIRAVDTVETEKLDADIVELHRDSRIFHVKYIQALLSFYLGKTFRYDPKENDTIAWFIVYYNATHRGDMGFFSSRYKGVVLRFLSSSKVGLARRYTDWPGKTQIVIPLSQNPLNQALRLDTLALGDEKTIETLRKEPDKGIEERKELLEMQKEQIASDEKVIQQAKEEISQEKKEIAKQKEETTQKETTLQQKEKEVAQKKQEEATLPPGPEKEKAKQEIAQKETAVAQEKKALEQQKQEVAQKEAQVVTQEKKVAEAEKKLEQEKQQVAKQEEQLKQDETETSRTTPEALAKKEQELAQRETNIIKQEETLREGFVPDIKGGKLYYLKINGYYTDGHYSNEMLIIDPVKRSVLTSSPYKSIGGHKFDFSSEGIVVIGFEPLAGSGTKATRSDGRDVLVGYEGPRPENYVLVMLNETNLGVRYKGSDTIFWRSFVEVRGESIYVIIPEKDKYYLSRFDLLFKKQAQTKEPVDPNTFISFFGDEVFVNSTTKEVLVLDKESLEVKERIKP
ncbi:P83/100 family protein [Thermospira aquatica]|uniref:Uncharacterized protein n=1 Tax=Thermospira aquatica TaxID=2828656 RepID=A0AAX3BBN4_9SPIR|nr:P83/100 family protein [Thermospira aquatica]URA09589.1 hypothetical protein KDW03_08845 [Thermospira aquatica]